MKTKSHSQKGSKQSEVLRNTLGNKKSVYADNPTDKCQENPAIREEGVKTGMKPTKLTSPKELEVVNQSPDISKEQDKYMDNLIKYGDFSSKEWCEFCGTKENCNNYYLGRKDYEKELMIKGKFHTSMNRKVCYDAGYKQGRKDAIEEEIKSNEEKKE